MNRKKCAKSTSKPAPILAAPKKTTFDGDNDVQFELELCWCVQQLRTALDSGKLSQKVAEDTAKNLKILMSQTAPLIKKRQVMKLALGDYRLKMQQEEKKMLLASKQIKFTPASSTDIKSSFVKKSALLKSGKDFRFNFDLADSNGVETTTNTSSAKTISIPVNENKEPAFKFNFSVNDDVNDDINLEGLLLRD
ncbi:UPF0488 protein CG14286 [Scaptodrosophila lebanonensis]|uniref:UPF0488 protein CG14286 n=1 Tax=Drosophila lebanonensis TaxID=7225 RepID=A0A6J2TTL8_DROLE|nr:UPF0488 protein CG14286 [Scaptodrosophila lebanonensis]XP_030379420.1 UPF0488 protein CG14286 [Scaptodrosophila lebanonensis]